MAHVVGFAIKDTSHFWRRAKGRVRKIFSLAAITALKNFSACAFLITLIWLCYLPNIFEYALKTIFSPTYVALNEGKLVASLLKKNLKVLFLDGRFGYIAVQVPNKCIDMPPDITANEFYLSESNPGLARNKLESDKKIAYILVRKDNMTVRRMLEREFNARVLLDNVTGDEGMLYVIDARVH